MGKKVKKIKGDKISKPLTLIEQIQKEQAVKQTISKEKEERPDDQFVEESLGKKITKLSQEQLAEEYHQENKNLFGLSNDSKAIKKTNKKKSNFNGDSDAEEEDDLGFFVSDNIDSYLQKFEQELNIDKEDGLALQDFTKRNHSSNVKENLRERLTERLTEVQSDIGADSVGECVISEEEVAISKKIGALLKRYRSGPLPKLVKRYPIMKAWEEYIFLTEPANWSAAAVYQVTRSFVTHQPAHILQRYLNLVVLPRFRDDVSYYKKVNFHIYQTLCKTIFKPAAFVKGILFPLCQSGDCSLREAIILGSVIARKKIPILHSAAAINFLAEMKYSGATSIFLRIYFDKKYHLPYRVIDAIVHHFLRFQKDYREYPVLWHQSLLTFIQRYKESITVEQKDCIMKLIRVQFHHRITPEIRREIVSSKSRAMEAMYMETN